MTTPAPRIPAPSTLRRAPRFLGFFGSDLQLDSSDTPLRVKVNLSSPLAGRIALHEPGRGPALAGVLLEPPARVRVYLGDRETEGSCGECRYDYGEKSAVVHLPSGGSVGWVPEGKAWILKEGERTLGRFDKEGMYGDVKGEFSWVAEVSYEVELCALVTMVALFLRTRSKIGLIGAGPQVGMGVGATLG
ncbi:hypothetical protein ANO11243_074970 [Dothideomycetidae sp. 11243]|nr:hypothetical protein ANO11243_074970 [fungal sp. No.11243]